jgi:hypothetical protein
MLIRVSLIIAIVASLAVGTLNFIKVKEKVTQLQSDLKEQTEGRQKAETDARDTHKALDKTTVELNTTKQTLATTTEERDTAQANAAAQQKRADGLSADLNKTRQERDSAQQDLAAYKATGVNPEQIVSMRKNFKALQDNLDGQIAENKVLDRELKKTKARLAVYLPDQPPIYLPADLAGKVLVADPKWNFVVLNVGEDKGVLERGQLLVNRQGKLVAKVEVRSIQKDRCIANVLPGWSLGDIVEGDLVIPAYPQQ